MVLDEHHGHAGGLDSPDQSNQSTGFRTIQTGGRFIRQDKLRLADEGTRNFKQPLMAIRKASGDHIRRPQQAHEIQCFAGAISNVPFFLSLPHLSASTKEYFALSIGMQAHLHVFDRGHLAEEPKVLEGSANTSGGPFIRRHGADIADRRKLFYRWFGGYDRKSNL